MSISADSLAADVAALLRQAPDTWADTPKGNAKALIALTAADLIKRRYTLRVQLPGLEAKRLVLELSGEYGLVEAVEVAVQHLWAAKDAQHWEQLRAQTGEPIKPIVALEHDAWCITEQGRLARADLERGDSTPIDFVLKRGFFAGQLRLLPGGRIVGRQPVRGYGRVVSIENADNKPLAVSIERFPAAPELAEALGKMLNPMFERLANSLAQQGGPAEPVGETATPTKTKQSTERGEGRVKLIAALTKHHQYADGGCLNLEPIGNNELARMAGVSPSSASLFFTQEFGGYSQYRATCIRDASKLSRVLRQLNGDYSPYHLYGATPPDEEEREE